jgi:hypothetical protein
VWIIARAISADLGGTTGVRSGILSAVASGDVTCPVCSGLLVAVTGMRESLPPVPLFTCATCQRLFDRLPDGRVGGAFQTQGDRGASTAPGPATRDSFKRLSAIASPFVLPAPERMWSDEEWARILAGHASFNMDDKWDAFVEQNRLFLHRSWTGLGVYEALFTNTDGHWRIAEAVVESDRTSYRRCADEIETLCLELIIESVLLHRFRQLDWQRWRGMIARELAAARVPPGKLYGQEQEVLQGPDGRFLDLQQLDDFELPVWLHICVGKRWGEPVSVSE